MVLTKRRQLFEFKAKNHTVTQSSFEDPCRKLEDTTDTVGFDSGFQFVDPTATSPLPPFSITINDTAPVWVYCRSDEWFPYLDLDSHLCTYRQTGHCGKGMVFAVNSDDSSDRGFAAFAARAGARNGTSS
jgi:hypothetical protein